MTKGCRGEAATESGSTLRVEIRDAERRATLGLITALRVPRQSPEASAYG